MTVKQEEVKLGTSKGCERLAGFGLSPLFALILSVSCPQTLSRLFINLCEHLSLYRDINRHFQGPGILVWKLKTVAKLFFSPPPNFLKEASVIDIYFLK